VLARDWRNRKPSYDLVIVGSGYGGAILAARIATAPLNPTPSICLLERGKEWPVGSFPDMLDRYLAENRSSSNPLGLYETLNYRDISVVKGNGLGGTSLLTANVTLEPDPDVFAKSGWPRSLTHDSLQKYFVRAKKVLDSGPHPRAAQLPKIRALSRAAGVPATPLDIAVNFRVDGVNEHGIPQRPCIDCGDCMTGCNVGAKNTLPMNYLPIASNAGAEIYTQAEVEWIEKLDGGWRVHGAYYINLFQREKFHVDARNVVVAAGAINTTEILMRSEHHGLKVSPRLGSSFSGNGDFFAVAYNGDLPVHSAGFGNHPERPGAKAAPGPTIVGAVHRNPDRPLAEQFVVQDSTFPSAFLGAAQAAFALFRGRDTDVGDESEEKSRMLADLAQRSPWSESSALARTLLFLVMSHDSARGSMVFEAPWWEPDGRLKIVWDDAGRQAQFWRINSELLRMTRALGGRFIEHFFWSAFNLRRLVTLHPLGGCPIGEDYLDGAVDEFGRVFSGDGTVHEGLFVADGSLVPSALGANPMLTICALAEHIAERKVEQMQGNDYPTPKVSVGLSALDPAELADARDAELEKLFRRCPPLGIERFVNHGGHRVDLERRRIFNDTCWKGLLPRGLPLGEFAAGLFTGYYKHIWKEGYRYVGETRYLDGRVPLHHAVEPITIKQRTGDLDPGSYILVRYTDPVFSEVFYDVLKVISDDIAIYRGYTGQFPNGQRGLTAPLLRGYGFDQMSADDHRLLYEAGRVPSAAEVEGVWRMDAVANANHASALAHLQFNRKPDGRIESRYQLLGLLEGLVMPNFVSSHFQLHDFTPFHDEIRLLDPDFLIGRWVMDLPAGIGQMLPATSAGLLHTVQAEDGRKQFGFFYILTRLADGKMPRNALLAPFLDVVLPDGIGLTFDERMEGWYLDDFAPPGEGRLADRSIAGKAPTGASPPESAKCVLNLRLSVADLNEFIDGSLHEARAAGAVEFSSWQGGQPAAFRLDEAASRFYYLRVTESSGEAEIVYELFFEAPGHRRFLLEARKYMQKDEGAGLRGMSEVLDDYTTLYVRLHEIAGDARSTSGSGLLKFRTFENAAAVGDLSSFLLSWRVMGTSDPVLQMQARLRFLAFTAQFVQAEYDPLSLDMGVLRTDVQQSVLRGADTPDYFSTEPTVELQSVLRSTPTLPLESLINKGGVRIDFEKRRIFRDSFWKGSFAADHLLGWEERVRTAALGGSAERMGATFAGGSFWKRFDSIDNGAARGQVVNYELEWLPGDSVAREIEYPNDSRRYFTKGDRILLMNYRNQPYRIVYDTIKVIDEQNAIGVMHLGEFPTGLEFATFVMARNNYPFEKMAIEDHQLLFGHPRVRQPAIPDLHGQWTGHLIFLARPAVSLTNQANPALFRVSFREDRGEIEARYQFGFHHAGLPEFIPELLVRYTLAEIQQKLRVIDSRTLLGRWPAPDLDFGLFNRLRDHLETGRGRPVFYFALTSVVT